MSKVTINAAIKDAIVNGKNASKYGRVKEWSGSICTGNVLTTADNRVMYEAIDAVDTITKWVNLSTFSGTIGSESYNNFKEPAPKAEKPKDIFLPKAAPAPKAIKPKATKAAPAPKATAPAPSQMVSFTINGQAITCNVDALPAFMTALHAVTVK